MLSAISRRARLDARADQRALGGALAGVQGLFQTMRDHLRDSARNCELRLEKDLAEPYPNDLSKHAKHLFACALRMPMTVGGVSRRQAGARDQLVGAS